VIAAPDALLLADSVPQAAALQPVPDSAQVTPLFALSLATVAVNACVSPVCTDAVGGDTATEIAAGVLELDPPPHPLTKAAPTIANANKNRAARTKCARGKSVPRLLPQKVFPGLIASVSGKLLLCVPMSKPLPPKRLERMRIATD
jgi:hypothetical protein